MRNISISIILPVYNGAWCIRKAIESVRLQKGDWELIVVDDGSTDKTDAIVRSYADRRIRLLESPGKGVTSARLYGTQNAVGEFVFFMDADDDLPEGIINRMEKICHQNPKCDVVVSDIAHVSSLGQRYIQKYATDVSTGLKLFDWIIDNRTGFIWGKAIRRDLMLKLPLVPKDVRFCEDYVQMLQISLLAGEIKHAGIVGYNYIQHKNSVCNRRKTRYDYAMQFYTLSETLYNLIHIDVLPLNGEGLSPIIRIKVMFLFYMRLYFAVIGECKDTKGLKKVYDKWLADESLRIDPLFSHRRRRQCQLIRLLAPLFSAIYVPLLRYKYKRIL